MLVTKRQMTNQHQALSASAALAQALQETQQKSHAQQQQQQQTRQGSCLAFSCVSAAWRLRV
jgi:hypothetical protein